MKRPVRWFFVYSCVIAASFIVLLTSDILRPSESWHTAQPLEDNGSMSIPPILNHPYNVQVNLKILQDYNISESMLLERQTERQRHLLDNCNNIRREELTSLKPMELRSIYVDDTHRTLYCAVPKVATTNWKRVFLMLTGKMNVSQLDKLIGADVHGSLQAKHLLRLDRLPRDEIRRRLNTYFKFMFVRDPFERLVSAYKSKFLSGRNTYFQKRDGRRIIRRYRANPLNESLERGHDVSFNEFVQYIIDPQSPRPFNEHWRPYQQLCKPCQIQYDVIGKYETLEEDAVHVIAAMSAYSDGESNIARFPAVHRTNRTADLELQLASVTHDDIRQLCNVYSDDLNLFAYKCPTHLAR